MAQRPTNELMEHARRLVPVLRERAAHTDSERKVPAESIADLRAAGLLDVLLPRALGGSEVDFSVFSAITRLLATGCGSTAWVYAILTETAWMAALFPQKAQEEAWEDRSALFCASVVPYGKARKVDGGYRLSGRWQYLSGSDYATWVVLHASVEGEDSIGTLVPRSELRMIDDWQVLGLAGTGSMAGAAEDVFVPAWRTLRWSSMLEGTSPGRAVHPDYVLARAPRHQIIDHHAKIAFGAIKDDRRAASGLGSGIEAGHQALGPRLFVAGGAVDLPGQEKSRQTPCF